MGQVRTHAQRVHLRHVVRDEYRIVWRVEPIVDGLEADGAAQIDEKQILRDLAVAENLEKVIEGVGARIARVVQVLEVVEHVQGKPPAFPVQRESRPYVSDEVVLPIRRQRDVIGIRSLDGEQRSESPFRRLQRLG